MLELSLSLLAGFAAITAYVIFGDEIRANRKKQQPVLKQPVSPQAQTKPAAKTKKPAVSSVAKPGSSKPKPIKAETATDPLADTAQAIMAHLTKNGPVTVSKLTKDLDADHELMRLATEKLINDKKVTSIKRGGHPALTLYS